MIGLAQVISRSRSLPSSCFAPRFFGGWRATEARHRDPVHAAGGSCDARQHGRAQFYAAAVRRRTTRTVRPRGAGGGRIPRADRRGHEQKMSSYQTAVALSLLVVATAIVIILFVEPKKPPEK